MFRLAYNANGLRTLPLERAIAEVADAGFDAIELSLHQQHIDPFTFTESDAYRVRAALESTGITACALATGADNLLSTQRFEPSLIHPTEAGRMARVDVLRRAIAIARWLGIDLVNFASGIRQPEVSPEQADRWLREGLKVLSVEAGADVLLAMEPEPGFFVQTNDQVATLREGIGADNFVLCQDLGHCRVVEEDYLGSVERNLSITTHIQIEDIKGRHHYHEIPGDGDIDFAAFLDIVERGGYRGYLSVELYNHVDVYHDALRRSYAFLRSVVTV